jgi:hypothetical protein
MIRTTISLTKCAIQNALMLGVIVSLRAVYSAEFAHSVPQEWMLVVNFVVVPAILGALAYAVFTGKRSVRLALVSTIPVLWILFEGGDPAKPGLEIILIGPLVVIFLLGAGISLALQWFFCGRNSQVDTVIQVKP